jgi:hypothetical protein
LEAAAEGALAKCKHYYKLDDSRPTMLQTSFGHIGNGTDVIQDGVAATRHGWLMRKMPSRNFGKKSILQGSSASAQENSLCSFLDSPATKFHWKCTGVKACELLHGAIRMLEHTYASEEVWGVIRQTAKSIKEESVQDINKLNAFA